MTRSFQPTRWTLVARATKDDAPAARAALDELCRLYWPPLCAFAQRCGLSAADAENVTQSYFAELLRNDKFALADAARGKLRTFLLHSFTFRLKNFRQRDPSRGIVPLDEIQPGTTEVDFNREWAITTMHTALTRIEAEHAQSGNCAHFDAFRPLLSLETNGNDDYAALAQQLGMKEGAVRVATHRLRHRFRELLFSVIAETLDNPSEASIRAEIGLLVESLA